MKKEYDFSKMKELKNPYAGKKQAVGINLSPEVVDYFKGLADETGLPYQKLIDLYLLDCAKKRKKLTMNLPPRLGPVFELKPWSILGTTIATFRRKIACFE